MSHPAVSELLGRSNRLGADPRNTNYAGGNTSAQAAAPDQVTGTPVVLVWCKGSGGETAAQIGARLDRVLERARTMLASGDVALVGHGHALRVLTARWLGLPPQDGALFRLDTGTLSVPGYEREPPVLLQWNA